MNKIMCGLFFAAMVSASPQLAVGCPYCNIYNLLDEHVREAKDIYVGEIQLTLNRDQAWVKVVKVLRGSHKVGSSILSGRCFDSDVGDRFVYCDSRAHDRELEEEIRYLLQGRPAATSAPEAIWLLKGISVKTQERGMEYVAAHHAEMVKPLIAELKTLVPEVLGDDPPFADVSFGGHRLAKLAEALLLEPTEEGRQYLYSQIDCFGGKQSSPIGWAFRGVLALWATAVSLVLAGVVRLGTSAFLHRNSARSHWPRTLFIAIPIVLIGFPAEYWYRSFHRAEVWLILLLLAIGLWLVLVMLIWLGTRLLLREPFPAGRRSWLFFLASAAALLMAAAWYAYPVPRFPPSRAVFFRDLLRPTAQHPELRSAVRDRTFDMCAKRKGASLAEATYAMVLSGVATPDEVQTRLATCDPDMLALGLFFAGNNQLRWWGWESAHEYFKKSRSLSQSWKLRSAVSNEIDNLAQLLQEHGRSLQRDS